MLVGLSAGAINGSLLNQLATVKHQSWGKEGAKFLETAFLMYRRGGIRPFFKGNLATTQRDTIFGVVYETGRHSLKQYVLNRQDQSPLALPINIACDCTAAAFGTIMSSPLNYVRNMKYASSASCKAPSTRKILVSLWKQALRHHKEGLAKGDPPLKALCRGFGYLQDRLRIGWGTARVAVGMALGQTLFDATKRCLSANFGNSEATEWRTNWMGLVRKAFVLLSQSTLILLTNVNAHGKRAQFPLDPCSNKKNRNVFWEYLYEVRPSAKPDLFDTVEEL